MVRERYVGTVRLFWKGTGTVRWFKNPWLFFELETLFELKTPDFSHIAPIFCTQTQKTAETDAKYVNWNRWYVG